MMLFCDLTPNSPLNKYPLYITRTLLLGVVSFCVCDFKKFLLRAFIVAVLMLIFS